jgi:hypothetical protein
MTARANRLIAKQERQMRVAKLASTQRLWALEDRRKGRPERKSSHKQGVDVIEVLVGLAVAIIVVAYFAY